MALCLMRENIQNLYPGIPGLPPCRSSGDGLGVLTQDYLFWDFPGGAVVKNPPANAGDMGSSPSPGRSHMPQSN